MSQEFKQRKAPRGWVAGRFEIETRQGRGHRDGWFHPELGVGLCPGRGEMSQLVEVTSLDSGMLLLSMEEDWFDVAFAMNKQAEEVAKFLALCEEGAATQEQLLDLEATLKSGARGYKGRAWRAWRGRVGV